MADNFFGTWGGLLYLEDHYGLQIVFYLAKKIRLQSRDKQSHFETFREFYSLFSYYGVIYGVIAKKGRKSSD